MGGLCIPTAEWEAFVSSLDAWIAAFNAFLADGGIAPCQDYEAVADEVDAFLETMMTWYTQLLESKLALYTASFEQLDVDIQAAYVECNSTQTDLRQRINAQFADLQDQIDFIWETPNPNGP